MEDKKEKKTIFENNGVYLKTTGNNFFFEDKKDKKYNIRFIHFTQFTVKIKDSEIRNQKS